MDKILRTLIENEEISLVAVDTTEMARHAQIIHNMTPASARLFARVLTVVTYMAGWLKDETGEISVNLKHDGEAGEVCVSGNGELHVRGYVYNPFAAEEKVGKGYMTVVRDDNYKRPFVGTCETVSEDPDKDFEYYYRLSEQLPTYIRTDATFDEHGLVKSSGGIFLQPMPGASVKSRQYAENAAEELSGLAERPDDAEKLMRSFFDVSGGISSRTPEYRCKCSREYVAGVLKGMGEKELRDIVRAEGKINVHCHYCNSDYGFFEGDIDEMFPKKD